MRVSIAKSPRLLRHTPGTLEPLAENSAHQFASQFSLVHYASGTIFTFIPKNACTSLRVSLAIANGAISETAEWAWVHQNNSTFSATLSDLARASATSVILRCPYRRLASMFLDKIVSRGGELTKLFQISDVIADPDGLTFRQFVDLIDAPQSLRADIHWRPQTDFLVYKEYDQVFGMEDLNAFADFFETTTSQSFVDARPLSKHSTSALSSTISGAGPDTPLADLTREKSNGHLPHAADLFDKALIAQVDGIYAQDLEIYCNLVGSSGLLFPGRSPLR